MDFSVNFMQSATLVLKEATKLKKYKAMPLGLAIATGVLMLPVLLVSISFAVLLYVLGYLFSVICLPTKKLHELLHNEGQGVKHATQFVIYFLSWSIVFTAYAVLSFFLIVLTILYSIFSILTYVWSLGGFKFHVFAGEEDVAVEVSGKYNVVIPIVYIAVMGVLLILLPLVKTLPQIGEYAEYTKVTFKLFMDLFKVQIKAAGVWRFLFSLAYSAFAFGPNPKTIVEE